MRNLNDCTLGIAVQQQITLAIDNNRAANFIRPIIIMRDTAQGAFDSAQDHWGVFKRFFTALCVNNCSAIGALATNIARCVSIIATHFAISGVAINHRIHVASGHAKKQVWLAKGFKRLSTLPIRLGNNADPKTLIFEHPPDHGHTKAGMINIGITRDNNDVTAIPPELSHLVATHRQKGSHAKTRRPELAIAAQGLGVTWKEGNVGISCHVNRSIRLYAMSAALGG